MKADNPPEIANSGATGIQTTPTSSEEATAIARFAGKGGQGLRPVTTPELLDELARSGDPADVREKLVVSHLFAGQQAIVAEVRVRLQKAEKENRRLNRRVAKLLERVGILNGDKRVLKQQLMAATSDRGRRTFLAAVGSVVFGFAGGFLGNKAWVIGILCFTIGVVLFWATWVQGVKPGDETV